MLAFIFLAKIWFVVPGFSNIFAIFSGKNMVSGFSKLISWRSNWSQLVQGSSHLSRSQEAIRRLGKNKADGILGVDLKSPRSGFRSHCAILYPYPKYNPIY